MTRALLLLSAVVLLVALATRPRALADVRILDEGRDAGIAHTLDCRGVNIACSRTGSTARLLTPALVTLSVSDAGCDSSTIGAMRYEMEEHGAALQWCPGTAWHDIPSVHRINADYDFPNIGNNSCAGVNLAFPMARPGDACLPVVPEVISALDLTFECHSADDGGYVRLDACNGSGGSANPPDASYGMLLFHP